MLKLFILFIVILLISPSEFITFPIILFITYIYYLSNINMYFCSSITSNLDFVVYDEVSLFITFLLFFIIFISYISAATTFGNYKLLGITLYFLFFFCFIVFNTCHLFLLYFFYEASLVPILFIIVKWGSYPERSTRVLMIISYTLLFGVPMFIIIISIYLTNNSWLLSFIYFSPLSTLSSILVFLCFAVKLPIYGLHYWLPIAHVEAPTFGSVILARVLLKLGGVGLIRLLPILDIVGMKSFILSYLILFTIYSTLVCCFQSDFKRLIAYSSVSHIIVIPLLILRRNILSIQRIILVILLHGISSSLIFFSVGLLYRIFSTRQLVLLRGFVLISPLFSLILVLTFFFTLSAPPFPSYVAEVYFILSTYALSPYILSMFIPFVFLGLVYNLNWLTRILFNKRSNVSFEALSIPFSSLFPFIMILIKSLLMLSLFFSL